MDQTMNSYHEPVLADECVRMLEPAALGIVVDGTFGGGGHTRRLLDAYPRIRIIGIDRDPDALANTPDDPRVSVVLGNFAEIERIVDDELDSSSSGPGTIDGVLLDLGISSHQVDAASRGFSYHRSGPVDMRMGTDVSQSAGDIVNEYSRDDLVDIIRRFGEERFARRIADAIVAARPIEDTTALAAVIAGAVPAAARRGGHPARKTFQALRIATNAELDALSAGLDAAIELLGPGGRICVISYHSLEDRIVKRRIVSGTTGCVCPPELPVCGCEHTRELKDLGRFRPSVEEIARNPRARSAIMRVAEKVPA